MAPSTRTARWVVMAVALAAGLTALAVFGVRLANDTPRYLDGAQRLLDHQPAVGRQAGYLSYLALVAAVKAAGLGYPALVLVQVAVAALAAGCLHDLGAELGGPAAGWAAGLFVALNPDGVRWHLFVLPESLYTSGVIIACWAIWRARWGATGRVAVALLAVGAVALQRPHGWILVLVAPLHWASRAGGGWRRLTAAGALGVLVAAAGGSLTSFGEQVGVVGPEVLLRRGEVVWGYPPWRLAMPVESEDLGSGAMGGLRYAARHPLASAEVALARVAAELAHARPFYSRAHNLALLLLLPLYALAVLGLRRAAHRGLAALLASVIGGHLLVVALVLSDWDGRLLLHVLPLIAALAAAGATGWGAGRRTDPAATGLPPPGGDGVSSG